MGSFDSYLRRPDARATVTALDPRDFLLQQLSALFINPKTQDKTTTLAPDRTIWTAESFWSAGTDMLSVVHLQ
jgi:hypothetical protein